MTLPAKAIVAFLGGTILYIILAERPFSFLASGRLIDQGTITSSVVNILCDSEGQESTGGSGTIITTEGIVITNSHVIPQDEVNILTSEQGCLVILPNGQSGQPEEMYWAKPLVIPELSDKYDLAYVQIYDAYLDEDGEKHGPFPRTFPSIFAEAEKYDEICLGSEHVRLGDPIKIYGYPQASGGFSLTITEGVISSLPGDGLILTSAKVDEGNSGGLAVDQRGCMVGIPSAVREGRYQNLGVIISTSTFLDFSNELSALQEEP